MKFVADACRSPFQRNLVHLKLLMEMAEQWCLEADGDLGERELTSLLDILARTEFGRRIVEAGVTYEDAA